MDILQCSELIEENKTLEASDAPFTYTVALENIKTKRAYNFTLKVCVPQLMMYY